MESEKVKEIKKVLEDNANDSEHTHLAYIEDYRVKLVAYRDILTLINELEAENKKLRTENRLYTLELGKKDRQEYEKIITDVRKDTLKDFREKYKEALKQEVGGENIDCFVESLKIFDKTFRGLTNE